MTPDEELISEHSVELPNRSREVRLFHKRSARIMGVAVCLAMTGVIVGIVIAERERSSDRALTTDALQREELREGWQTLGAAAALEAQTATAQPDSNAAPAAPATNVVIVNVPGQPGAPQQVVQPAQPAQTTVVGSPSAASTGTATAPGNVPAVTYVAPVAPVGSMSPATSSSPAQVPGGVIVPTFVPGQSSGNGSVSGSSPNPALPNNGTPSSPSPTPGLPNGSSNVPSGSLNLPTGSPNLPTGSSSLPSGVP